MIVYRDCREYRTTESYLKKINLYYLAIGSCDKPSYSALTSLLIESGEFETGITDADKTECKELSPLVVACHEITLASAVVLCEAWKNGTVLHSQVKAIRDAVDKVAAQKLPHLIPACIPEGFAFYGLYPEQYIEAAEKFFALKNPNNVICIGLRSIGTSLCALVASVLEMRGCRTWSFTVRPKGHPFERHVELTSVMKEKLSKKINSYFAIIDEGPGLSGSSICGTLNELNNIGIPKENVVIFPSWNPDESKFISKQAKKLWPEYEKITSEFSDVLITNGKLEQSLNKKILFDFSAGNWRESFFNNNATYPAVHPHHEKRKFLLSDSQKNRYLGKWVGLGKYGGELYERAMVMSDSGFSPQVHGMTNGIIVMQFLNGVPMQSIGIDKKFIGFAIDYFNFIQRNFPADLCASFEKMKEMVYTNIFECLGEKYEKKMRYIDCFPMDLYQQNVIAIDGRLKPHEWIKYREKYFKVDNLEHHCDQFFHGCQNIAWDIAAFCIEFDFDKKKQMDFIDLYKEKSGDKDIGKRVPFFRVAYLAYRLGYVSMAADSLKGSIDCERFCDEKKKYRKILVDDLNNL